MSSRVVRLKPFFVTTSRVAEVGLFIAGAFFAPLDWALTLREIYREPSNPWSYAGLFPLVPAGFARLANAAERIPTNTLNFQGLEVRAVRNLSHVDDATLRAMADKGFAARTVNGDKIVLHHHQQNPAGFIVEVPAPNHSIGNVRQHPFGNTAGAGLSAEQRAAFDSWRGDYWRMRAQEELARRAAGGTP